MARLDIRDMSDELLAKLDKQVATLGLKTRSEYIRLVIELDFATNLISKINEVKNGV